jgi:hypothetical protein
MLLKGANSMTKINRSTFVAAKIIQVLMMPRMYISCHLHIIHQFDVLVSRPSNGISVIKFSLQVKDFESSLY